MASDGSEEFRLVSPAISNEGSYRGTSLRRGMERRRTYPHRWSGTTCLRARRPWRWLWRTSTRLTPRDPLCLGRNGLW
ncbi:hypothetical protein ACSQ67_025603 [Phaseolus vulgaris]